MILIHGGILIDPLNGKETELDLLIEAGKIKAVDRPGAFKSLKVTTSIDANKKWIMPGLVDLHVHLREPGFEWKETIKTGSSAAILGGYTTICCMPNTKPTNDSAEITQFIIEKAREAQAARVLPIGSVSLALKGKEMSPFSELHKAGCVAFSDDGEPIWDAGLMRRALEWCLMLGVPISCHEEDKNLSCGGCMNESPMSYRLGLKGMPKVAEDVMVSRDIELCRVTKGRVHICHVSTARSVELIRRAKNDGINITCEVTPHHLVLTEERVGEYDTFAKMSPPLREQEDIIALQQGLKDGTIDAVASDHAPHDLDSKNVEFAKASFGILGLQTSLSVVLKLVAEGKLSRSRAVEVLSSGPCRAFNLEFGNLAPGKRADIAIVDPEYRWTFRKEVIKSLSVNSPFLGEEFKGVASTVLLDGIVRVAEQKLVSEQA